MRSRGVALIVVLWITAFLTVIAGAIAASARTEAFMARNLVAVAQARQAAEAGVQLAVYQLLTPNTPGEWYGDGTVQTVPIGDINVQTAIVDESGRIDLNAAPAELLDGLLQQAEVEDGLRGQLVDAILDWRDEDDLRRLNGAEDDDYRRAGRSYGAKDAQFDTVEELQLVLGMTPEIYRKIAAGLTVYSHRAGINPGVALPLVLKAVPGVSPADVDAYVALRSQYRDQGVAPPPPPTIDRQFLSPARGQTYTVYASARLADGSVGQVAGTLQLRRTTPKSPFTMLSWRVGPSVAESIFPEPVQGGPLGDAVGVELR